MTPKFNTAAKLLKHELSQEYYGKVILNHVNKPYKVYTVEIVDDTPDPGWMISFKSWDNTTIRYIFPDEPLPEIFPEDIIKGEIYGK